MSGDTLIYSVRVKGADPKSAMSYKWSVSVGEIKSGQGTASITVDRPNNTEGFTATAEVAGLPDGCGNKASCTTTH
jgi:hypothetical protein